MHRYYGQDFCGRSVSRVRSNSGSDFRIHKQARLVSPVAPKHSMVDSTTRGEPFVKNFDGYAIRFPSITYGHTALRYMGRAGSTGPKSNEIDASHSAAFLLISPSLANSSSEIPAADARHLMRRRDLTCLFECNFGSGDKADVRTSIHSSMVSNDNLQNQGQVGSESPPPAAS